MSELQQHELAARLLQVLKDFIPPNLPTTYKNAAEALGRDGRKNARMIAQVCDLLDAAAAKADIPLLALVAVQESSGRFNHKAFAGRGAPSWLREAIIERSSQHKFTERDFATIASSLRTLSGLGNIAAWKEVTTSMSKEQRYSRLTGLDEATISAMLGVESQAHEPQYWAFVADPSRYRIVDAVSTLQSDTWTSKGRLINPGDYAAIWQSRDKNGNRGIVALAQITETARMRDDRGNPYWVNPSEAESKNLRVGLRYVRIARPLWMNGAHHQFLQELAVAKARGGTIFHLKAPEWHELRSFIDDADFDIEEVKSRTDLKRTQREAFIQARLGQGRFRQDLFARWHGCAVIGCRVQSVLRASHIKPWSKCSDRERLDSANGLLLVANLDALFNDGLITFADDGKMIASDRLQPNDRSLLQTQGNLLKKPTPRQREYLKYHRDNEFF